MRKFNEPLICEEVAVLYSPDRIEGWMHLPYTWLHIPTGKSGVTRVYVLTGRFGLNALLAHWNRWPDWKYSYP